MNARDKTEIMVLFCIIEWRNEWSAVICNQDDDCYYCYCCIYYISLCVYGFPFAIVVLKINTKHLLTMEFGNIGQYFTATTTMNRFCLFKRIEIHTRTNGNGNGTFFFSTAHYSCTVMFNVVLALETIVNMMQFHDCLRKIRIFSFQCFAFADLLFNFRNDGGDVAMKSNAI